jgi:hypothetical protein
LLGAVIDGDLLMGGEGDLLTGGEGDLLMGGEGALLTGGWPGATLVVDASGGEDAQLDGMDSGTIDPAEAGAC